MALQYRMNQDHPATAARRVAHNTIYLAVADIANKLMAFVFFMVLARHLGASKFGIFSFALAFVNMFAVLTDFGLGFFTAREIARDYRIARRLVSNGIAIRLTASVLVIGIIALLVNLLGYPEATVRVVYICSVFVLTNALGLYYGNVFQGFERMQFTALSRLVQTAIMITGALLLVRGEPIVERYALLYVGAALVAVILMFILVSMRFVRPTLSFRLREWGRMLRPALPFGVTTILVAFYYWNGSVLLSKMCSDEAVGIYNAPFRLVAGVGFLAAAFSGAVYPLMSRMFVVNGGQLRRNVTERSLRYMVSLAVPLGVLGATLARPVTLLVYGAGYDGSVVVMRTLVWWGACVYINSLLSHYFFAINRPRTVTLQATLSLAVNVILNLLLIPRLGALGAAVSIVAAEATGSVFLFVNQLRTPGKVRLGMLLNFVARAFGAAVIVAPVAWLAARWHALAGLAIALLGYFALMVLFRGFGRDDLNMLRLMLRRDDG